MAIFLGFIASGTSRTRSITSRPSSRFGTFDPDVVGQFEAALEAALGDADVEELRRPPVLALAALHDKQVLLGGDVEVGGLEAGDRQRDAIGVVAAPLDVERGIVVAGVARGPGFSSRSNRRSKPTIERR